MIGRGVVIGLVVALALVAGGAALRLRSEAPAVTASPADTPAPAGSPAAGSTAAVPGGVPGGSVATAPAASPSAGGRLPGDAAAVPWLGPQGGTSSGAVAPPPVTVGRAGAPRLEDIEKRLQGLLASGQPDIRQLDAVLADLQKNQGSAVVSGVDLQAMRDNLVRADRIRELAQEMQALAAKPGPEASVQLQARMAEIQRLQAGMAGVAAPAGSAR